MTRAYVEAPATHYRLTPETWAIIAEEYRDGATAKDLGAKWKVAPSSVYRHACKNGWTKKAMGDARARAHARKVEEEAAAARGLNPVGTRALHGLFAPPREGEADPDDPVKLAREATLASGRAMKGRLWAEAKALAGLAESYLRVAAARGRGPESGAGGGERVPLADVARALLDPEFAARLMRVDPDDPRACPVRRAFWDRGDYALWCALPNGDEILKQAGMTRGDPALSPDAPWPAG